MAKGDYTNATTRNEYKTLVREQSLTKITVATDERRSRAELLDMIEELFETKSRQVTAEKLRAFLTILVLSINNDKDDVTILDGNTDASNLPTSNPGPNKIYVSRNVIHVGT
tara:strand:+ start:818 stop:1153 length:336 start_codon:yes stop_codon:yes gene_type:complete